MSSAPAPRVSVISIFFNAERYFREAIDSVLAQDFDDFELLLVDDGSTDASSAIADDYAKRHPERIRVLEHPGHANRGMSATRNLGLRHARGELVAFIDADDRWRPCKLREQVELLDRLSQVDAVCGAVNYWASHDGGTDRSVPTAHVRNRPIPPGEATANIYPLRKAHAPSMSDLLFRKQSIEAARGFEEAFRGAYEDQAFMSKFYLISTLYVTDEVWSDYRLHDESCMAVLTRQNAYDDTRKAFLDWFEHYVAASAWRNDAGVRDALDQALRPYRLNRKSLRDAAKSVPGLVPLVRSGKSALRSLKPMLRPGPAILMYHRVAEESFDPWGLAVSPANFAAQMERIARNHTALPLSDFARLHRRGELPHNAVAVTFDDGYACTTQTALPILEKFRIPATVFVPTRLVERGQEFWWDELEQIVMSNRVETLRLDESLITLGPKVEEDHRWNFGDGPGTARQRAYKQLWGLLYAKLPGELDASMAELRGQAGLTDAPRPSHRPVLAEELRALRSSCLEFGSHALTHPSLPKLAADEKRAEIETSIDRCAELTGTKPVSFAYPYGDFDPESAKLVEQAGYLCACIAEGRFVSRKSNRFALPRLFVGDWPADRLARELGRP